MKLASDSLQAHKKESPLKTIILPLTKSPCERGRVGPRKWQNWYRGCKKAVKLEKKFLARGNEVEILILTDFQTKGSPHDADYYTEALRELNASKLRVICEETETVGQIKKANQIAKREGKRLVVISSLAHFPRVWWICRGEKIAHSIVCGIPRPKEFITDIILDVAFPLIDILGQRNRFERFVEKRRESGKI